MPCLTFGARFHQAARASLTIESKLAEARGRRGRPVAIGRVVERPQAVRGRRVLSNLLAMPLLELWQVASANGRESPDTHTTTHDCLQIPQPGDVGFGRAPCPPIHGIKVRIRHTPSLPF